MDLPCVTLIVPCPTIHACVLKSATVSASSNFIVNTSRATMISPPLSGNTCHILKGPVEASFNFYQDPEDGTIPFIQVYPDKMHEQNYSEIPVTVPVRDIRGQGAAFGIDRDGFQAISGSKTSINDFRSQGFEEAYYKECEEILRSHVRDVKHVTIFDHTIRTTAAGSVRQPVTRVHVDQTPKSAEQRVCLHNPERAEDLLKGRYRIINVWRPLKGPVQSHPLAVISGSTCRLEDLVPVEHRYHNRTGETHAVRHNPRQQWCYWSGMDTDQVLLLKCFDSADGEGLVRYAPHSAFVDPRSSPDAPPRESIEVRALVYS